MEEIDLSICITSYNARGFLKNCLTSIYENPPSCKFEVIVTDGNSKDGTYEMVSSDFKKVILKKLKENPGFAASINEAIKMAKGKYIMSLNADTIIEPDALDNMINFLSHNPQAGMVSAKILNLDGSLQPTGRKFPTPISIYIDKFRQKFQLGNIFYKSYRNYNKVEEVDEVGIMGVMLPRNVIEKVGLIDEKLKFMYTDIDWCFRIKKEGFKVYYLPDTLIKHYYGGHTYKVPLLKPAINGYNSQLYFFKKHYSFYKILLLKFIMWIELSFHLLQILFFWIFNVKSKKELQEKYELRKFILNLLLKK
ncbi:glycosyltransferase family 2 protein [candidate division WOR-3 bacterium]|nr:glycosyltransferase family 2 protein [candidate division WOR-3 bacterium]